MIFNVLLLLSYSFEQLTFEKLHFTATVGYVTFIRVTRPSIVDVGRCLVTTKNRVRS